MKEIDKKLFEAVYSHKSLEEIQSIIDQGANITAILTEELHEEYEISSDTILHTALHSVVDYYNHEDSYSIKDSKLQNYLIEVLNFFLDRNSSIINTKNSNEVTPLFYAIIFENNNALKLLIERGADITGLNYQGLPATFYAIEQYNAEALDILLENGAELDQTFDGQYLLQFAVTEGTQAMVELLINKWGSSVNMKDGEGNTPLHLFIEGTKNYYSEKQENNFYTLLKYGADLLSKNNDNKFPLLLAKEINSPFKVDMVRANFIDNLLNLNLTLMNKSIQALRIQSNLKEEITKSDFQNLFINRIAYKLNNNEYFAINELQNTIIRFSNNIDSLEEVDLSFLRKAFDIVPCIPKEEGIKVPIISLLNIALSKIPYKVLRDNFEEYIPEFIESSWHKLPESLKIIEVNPPLNDYTTTLDIDTVIIGEIDKVD